MINAPWIFNTLWYFLKGLLSAKTVAKVSLSGAAFMSEMEKDIDPQFIPSSIGGAYNVDGANQELFAFDIAYFCPGMSEAQRDTMRQQLLEKEVREEVARREAAERAAAESPKSGSRPSTPTASAQTSTKS